MTVCIPLRAVERATRARKHFIYTQTNLNRKSRVPSFFGLVELVLVIKNYSEDIAPDGTIVIHNHDSPCCPNCGTLLVGYDHRRRILKDDGGNVVEYRLRRLYCQRCDCLHLEIPDVIRPQKHYTAKLIDGTINGEIDYCPADDSTIRRWKKQRKNT